MAETAVLTTPAKAVLPVRGAPKDAGRQGGEGAESGFAALLVAVEEVAQNGDRVLTADLRAAADGQLHAKQQGQGVLQTLVTANVTGEAQSAEAQTDSQAMLPGAPVAQQLLQGAEVKTAKPLLAKPTTSPDGKPDPRAILRALSQGQTPPAQASGEPADPRAATTAGAEAHAQKPGGAPLTQAQIEAIQAAAGRVQDPQEFQLQKPDITQRLETQIASTPKLEATLAQHSSSEASNPVVRQVASGLQFVARGDIERLKVDLHPEELGRVQVQLQKTGAVTRVTIVTETSQAFEMLKMGAGGLQQALADAGFDTDDMRFEHREDRGETARRDTHERGENPQQDDPQAEHDERRELLVMLAAPRTVFL